MVGEMNKQVFQPSSSKLGGLDAKYMVLIAYFGGSILGLIPGARYVVWLIPLIIFFVDKENKFIAFHAMQALLLQVVAVIIYIVLAIILAVTIASAAVSVATLNPYAFSAGFGASLAITAIIAVVGIVIFILAIIAAVKGYKYEIYEIPLVGKQAEKIVFKTA